MIESLPEHCIIDNDNHLTINDVDKQFYIDMAHKRISDFIGEEQPKKERKKRMATKAETTPMNVYQKLGKARLMLQKKGLKKSGLNRYAKFEYFELNDIVPSVTEIFDEIGLMSQTVFTDDMATMIIVNTENVNECISFTSPFERNVVSENSGMTPIQQLGSAHTYMRRYLYLLAMDIVENDAIDAVTDSNGKMTTPIPEAKKPKEETHKAPPTAQEREEIKKELNASDGNASELQIKQLKAGLKKLIESIPEKKTWVEQLAVKTKGFTDITKADCEQIIIAVGKMMEGQNA